MAITVNSPYSGRPVKVRDQDIGRAIRDEQGRVFYVLPRSEGDGYYAARTRKGSAKEEQAYLALKQMPAAQASVSGSSRAASELPHDATGKRRGTRPMVWVLLFILLAAAAYLGYVRYARGHWLWQHATTTPTTQPSTQPVSQNERQISYGVNSQAETAEKLCVLIKGLDKAVSFAFDQGGMIFATEMGLHL